MIKEELFEILKSIKPGTYHSITWVQDVSSSKAKRDNIRVTKISTAVVRLLITYNNGKEENGHTWYTHSAVRGVVQHKQDANKLYVQVFSPKNSTQRKSVKYLIDNSTVSTEKELLDKALISFSNTNKHISDIFVIPVENIISIH